jgi:hypothetical protein
MATTGIQKARDRVHAAVDASLEAVGILVSGQAAELVPVDTGRLKGSITWATAYNQAKPTAPAKDEDGVTFEGQAGTVIVGTSVSYGPSVEYGTGPHEIRPKDKKALFWKGAAHPVKKVMHPGSPAQSFLRRGLDISKGDIPEVFQSTFKRVMK